MMVIRFAQSQAVERNARETLGMAAVGEIPARDLEFEELLREAAEFQNTDSGCKLRGEAM